MSWIEEPNPPIINYGDMIINLKALKRDEYYLIATYNNSDPYSLWSKYDECVRCPFKPVIPLLMNEVNYTFNSRFSSEWIIREKHNDTGTKIPAQICALNPDVGQFGVYNLNILNSSCILEIIQDPVNIYLPILTVLIIYLSLGLALYSILFLYNRNRVSTKNVEENGPKKQRILAIDTFRGLCIVLTIFLNYRGGRYMFCKHATWNGLTISDILFPCFLWIMGVCIPISVKLLFFEK